ncbi:FG-GAP-like repeat-containing protein [Isosphaeraceae bacterium EP7]
MERSMPLGRRGVAWLVGASAVAALVGLGLWVEFRPLPTWKAIREASGRRRWAEAESMLGRWLRSRPDDGDAWMLMAGAIREQGRESEVAGALAKVGPTSRAWGRAQSMLGEIALQDRDAAAAERAFRNSAGRSPEVLAPSQRLVYLLSLQQRPAEARDVLWGMYRTTLDPRQLADLVLALEAPEADLRGLEGEVKPFLDRTPADPWLRRVWGLIMLQKGRPAEALPHLQAAAAAFEDDPGGRFALAECRRMLGSPEVDPALLGPEPLGTSDRARWWLLRARLDEARGRPADAEADLTHVLEIDAGHREAHYRLGQLLRRSGDADRAAGHIRRADELQERDKTLRLEHARLRREGFSRDACLHLGTLCREAGLPDEARAWFEQGTRFGPDRPDLRAAASLVPAGSGARTREPARPVLASRPTLPPPSPPAPAHAGGIPRFEDVARTAGIDSRYDCGAGRSLSIADTIGGGVGLIDYDGDGWLDIYFVNGGPLTADLRSASGANRLYRNRGDGTFEDVTARAGVAGSAYGMGCAVGDYDGDGHDDLFVTGLGRTILYRNRGDRTFEDATARAGVGSPRWTTAAGFADLDDDGDLDLVAITYVELNVKAESQCRDEFGLPIHCSPQRYRAEPDQLFRNNGDGTFSDVSREAGLEVPDGRGLGLAIADLDGDGRLDLFVANDTSPNFLFLNKGGLRFEEQGMASGVAFDGAGRATASMGVVADDLNGDGLIDLFHTNLINEGSILRSNLGGGQFMDATLSAGLSAPSRPKTGFAAAALDADNDGRLDLFVANGHIDDRPKIQTPMAQTPQLFLGRDGGRFEVMDPAGDRYFSRPVVGRGAAAGDLDNDGRVDLVVVHRDEPAAVLHNRTPGGHWLGVRLVGAKNGRSPVGARVRIRTPAGDQMRWQTGGTGYLSAHDSRLWFGLGSAPAVEHLEVRWPSGKVESWPDLPADQILEIKEGNPPRPMTASRPSR